jgi:hypothetical protein
MARALTGYGEFYGRTERHILRMPHTHPENMARAAGVLMETGQRTSEELDMDDDQLTTERKIGTKALVGAMA